MIVGPRGSSTPRFTEFLRSTLAENDLGAPTPTEDLFTLRRDIIDKKRRRDSQNKDASADEARNELLSMTIGPWETAVKEGRQAFKEYIQEVSKFLGSEATGEEIFSVGQKIWILFSSLPTVSEDELRRHGTKRNAVHASAKKALNRAFPSYDIEHPHVHSLMDAFDILSTFCNKIGKSNKFFSVEDAKCVSSELHEPLQGLGNLESVKASLLPVPLASITDDTTVMAACGITASSPLAKFYFPDLLLLETGPINGKSSSEQPNPSKSRVYSKDDIKAIESEIFGGRKGVVKNDPDINARWLMKWCASVNPSSCIDDDAIVTSVALAVITDNVSDDALAAAMFDILGEGVFDKIGELLEKRSILTRSLRQRISELREEDNDTRKSETKVMPSYGTGVSVLSEGEKAAMKAERKAERRRRHQQQTETAVSDEAKAWLSLHGLAEIVDYEKEREINRTRLVLGNGVEFHIGSGGSGARPSLPQGTVRRTFKGYEEVQVPPTPTGARKPGERQVMITELPGWAQLAFDGYKSLNRIQSAIFETAWSRNENMLVCAPTGAGKTNIAMLSVLHEIAQHIDENDGGSLRLEEFKIVYVAPMKALAAEVTGSFSKRLAPLGVKVRELTGDMQLSKKEMIETQMIVTTPEKWDVITRKGGEVSVASLVRLLIIDEVHLLNDERGPVIETLVARTTRQVETSQSMIRLVGLSATLPNFKDVAKFLGVNLSTGLFYFDASYRPVPLETTFVGVSEKNFQVRQSIMDEVCYQKVADSLKRGHQAMVFVHSRKETGKTARMIALKAQQYGETALFDCSSDSSYAFASKEVKKSKSREVSDLFDAGLGIHHAGLLRSDRSLTERMFASGLMRVLCCTATLAWGVNLPAHTVIIKGTQLYNPQKGGFTDLGMLDVQQIFGRAGRPQFQDSGEAVIMTTHDKLSHYLGMLTHSVPIESQFIEGLADHLNAEIVLGTVTNIREAVSWLGYTYLYVRMTQNPLAYGISWEELAADQVLDRHRRKLVTEAARELQRAQMARFDEKSGNIYVTELGRVASHFYISKASIETFDELLKPHLNEEDVFAVISRSSEFDNLVVREEELPELDAMARSICSYDPKGGSENRYGKANILLQGYVARHRVESFSLTADMNYVSQNAPRIARALFEICLRRGWPSASATCLTVTKALERRLWPESHPLWQLENSLKYEVLRKLEDRNFDVYTLYDMTAADIGAALRHPAAGKQVLVGLKTLPMLDMSVNLHPITRTVLRIAVKITPNFDWRDNYHGAAQRWLIWVEDSDNEKMYHSETWTMTKKMWQSGAQELAFAVPISEPLPSQYYIRAISESWLGCETLVAVSFKGLILPERHPPHTELLDLDPLPVSALKDVQYETLYSFSHFNPIQTQVFHTLYHTDENVLLGAPTGSGKTITAELAMMRLFNTNSRLKTVYIAPLKALVRERIREWSQGFCKKLNKRLVELTGDVTPDLRALLTSDIIVTTPEKWDGISRNWKSRSYVRNVALLIMDEIHLLGADRGPVLEVIVSRMRYVANQAGAPVRFIGLSTALANAADLSSWLGVGPHGLFNFKPSVRPVPLECHIQGYPGKFYCPRMATMNKPAYAAIQTHSPSKPVLIFVSSRRQTRLTALDIIAYAAADEKPRAFVHMEEAKLNQILLMVKDSSLRHTLQFGVGLHHAGLADGDRNLVEQLYVQGKIQVLVATSTLAWGVNTPAHLVIVKGTEYYDAPTKRYVDYPITDVLQMMGRAGRPQFDHHGVAVIMVHEPKKSFYKKFMYEPFPVESSLPSQLADHLNAEIATRTLGSVHDAINYLTWTFFLPRLLQNPSYYGLESVNQEKVNIFISNLIAENLKDLEDAGCISYDYETGELYSLPAGQIASLYYLKHETLAIFKKRLTSGMKPKDILDSLCSAMEYEELPVRHNEDKLNAGMVDVVRYPPDIATVDNPHTKASLLLQAHLSQLALPITDYVTDTKSVLDNSARILQAIVEMNAESGWLDSTLSAISLVQAISQGYWPDSNTLLQIPNMDNHRICKLRSHGITSLKELLAVHQRNRLEKSRARRTNMDGSESLVLLKSIFSKFSEAKEALSILDRLPVVDIKVPETRLRFSRKQDKNTKTSNSEEEEVRERDSKPRENDFWELNIELQRSHGHLTRENSAPRAYAPRFPKIKDEGWWLIAAADCCNEILALKRVSFGKMAKLKLLVPAHSCHGQVTKISLQLVSDCYLGVDIKSEIALANGI